jgi:hypothetical protein
LEGAMDEVEVGLAGPKLHPFVSLTPHACPSATSVGTGVS